MVKRNRNIIFLFIFCAVQLSIFGSSYEHKNRQIFTDTIATLLRGPYLQIGNTNSIIIRWKTNVPTTSKVNYGLFETQLDQTIFDSTFAIDHSIRITGLTNGTKYYYSIGSSIQTLQGDASNYFISPPDSNTIDTVNIWAMGDMGNNSANQRNVRDRYYNYMGSNYTDVWLLMGDNAYTFGYDIEYQTKFFDIYKDKILKQTLLCPAPGNHDYAGNAVLQVSHNIPYYDMFSLPTQGEMGGYPSGTESFYSFDYSNIHFISLDSYGKDSSIFRLSDTLGPQARWLKHDLALNSKKWTILYWHHPPYTMGSHNSDTEAELVNIRKKLLPIIERYNIDLILTGHSHDYERTRLIKGHYGNENTFLSSLHNIDSSSALYDGSNNSCPYIKDSKKVSGAIYAVVGSAGQVGGTQASFPHAAMYYSNATRGGALAIQVLDNKLVAKWVCNDGIIRDQFTIIKDVNKRIDSTITLGDSIQFCASWNGNHIWNDSVHTQKCITVSPDSSFMYIVKDQQLCIADTFNIQVCTPAYISSNSSNVNICENSTASFSVTGSGSGNISPQWQISIDGGINWTNITDSNTYNGIQTMNLQTGNTLPFMNGNYYRCMLSNSCGTAYSIPSLLTVNTIDTATINIISTSNTFCVGDSIHFIANADHTGTSPSYQWYVNHIPVGNNSSMYSSDSLHNNDTVVCVLTSNQQCIYNTTDSSNALLLNIQAYVTPAVIISTNDSTTIFPGDTVSFTAQTNNSGSNTIYQWFVNGIPHGNNSNNFTYASFVDGDSVNCLITQTDPCSTNDSVFSNSINISVQTLTAIENNTSKTLFKVSPNPFTETILIQFPSNTSGLFRITGELGIVLLEEKIIHQKQIQINSNELKLKNGIYFAEFISNNSHQVEKIVKVQ